MPSKCSVYGCCHRKDAKVSVFALKGDEARRREILSLLNFPSDYEPSSSFKICEFHFTEESVISSGERKKLIEKPLLKCEMNETDIEQKNQRDANNDMIWTFGDFIKSCASYLQPEIEAGWALKEADDSKSICLYGLRYDDIKGVVIDKSLVIYEDFRFSAWIQGELFTFADACHKKLNSWSSIVAVLADLADHQGKPEPDYKVSISGIISQIQKVNTEDETKDRTLRLITCQLKQMITNSCVEGVNAKMNEKLCRICLTSDESKLLALFGDDLQAEHVTKVIFCTGVEISENDRLPKKICESCLDEVISACDVKEKCIETDRVLRQQLKDEPGQVEVTVFEIKNEELEEPRVNPPTDPSDSLMFIEFFETRPEHEKEYKRGSRRKPNVEASSVENQESSADTDRRKSKVRDFRCFFCDKLFLTITTKKDHIKKEHRSELTCRVCNSRKTSPLATEQCLKDHKFGFDYLCQICAKPFHHKCYLVKHQATCHTEPTACDMFSCDQCGLQTKYKMNLQRHMKSVHMHRTKRFACPHTDTCADTFYTTRDSLNIHMYRVHDVAAPITCGSCQLGFSYISELRIHRRICCGSVRTVRRSTKNKNFKEFCEVVKEGFRCKVCQKVFTEKQNWSYHYSAHHRDNRTCHICDKEFTCYTNYRRHVNVHHKKIKNFHCEYSGCGKSFGQKGALNNHKNTHTGEKPFTCNFCSFRSGDTTTITKHKKKMHLQKQQIVQP